MNDNVNLDLWGKAYKTDPSATKSYKGAGGFQGTAIASLYPVQRATEVFGPLGDGWGFEIVADEFIQGGPLVSNDGESLGCNEQTHSIKIKLWAKHNGKTLESFGIGLTPHITKNKYGVQTDHEAQKKSLTDAIKGGLKLWGFSADVYMGDHDDPEYVKHLQNLEAMDKADDKVAEEIKQTKEYDDWKVTQIRLIETAVSVNEMRGVFKAAVLKAKRKEDNTFIKEMTLAAEKRKPEIEEQPEQTA